MDEETGAQGGFTCPRSLGYEAHRAGGAPGGSEAAWFLLAWGHREGAELSVRGWESTEALVTD